MAKSGRRRKGSPMAVDKAGIKKKKEKKGVSRVDIIPVAAVEDQLKADVRGSDNKSIESETKDEKPKKGRKSKDTDRTGYKSEAAFSGNSNLNLLDTHKLKRNKKQTKKSQPDRALLKKKTPLEIAMDEEDLDQKDRDLIDRAKTCYEEANSIWETAWAIISQRFYEKNASSFIALELRDTWLHLAEQQWMDEDFRYGSYLPATALLSDTPPLPLVFDSWSRGAIEVLPSMKRESVLDPFLRDNSNFLSTSVSDVLMGNDDAEQTEENKNYVRSAHIRRKTLFASNPHLSLTKLGKRDVVSKPSTPLHVTEEKSSQQFGEEPKPAESSKSVSHIFGTPVDTDDEWQTIVSHERLEGDRSADSIIEGTEDNLHAKRSLEQGESSGTAADYNALISTGQKKRESLEERGVNLPSLEEQEKPLGSTLQPKTDFSDEKKKNISDKDGHDNILYDQGSLKIVIAARGSKTALKTIEPSTGVEMKPSPGKPSEDHGAHDYHEQHSRGSLSSSEVKDFYRHNKSFHPGSRVTSKKYSPEVKQELVPILQRKSLPHSGYENENDEVKNHPLSLHRSQKVALFNKDIPDRQEMTNDEHEIGEHPPAQVLHKKNTLTSHPKYDSGLVSSMSIKRIAQESQERIASSLWTPSSAGLTELERYAGMSPNSSSDGYSSDSSGSSNNNSSCDSFQSTLSSDSAKT